MAQTDISVKLNSDAVLVDRRNAQHPFLKNVIILSERYVVGTDFTSGNGLDVYLYGAKKILLAIAKTPSGTLLTITETIVTTAGNLYIKLATGTSTTDIQLYVVYQV